MTSADRAWADRRVARGLSMEWWAGSRGTGAWFLDADRVQRFRRWPSLRPSAYECGLVGARGRRRWARMSRAERWAVYRRHTGRGSSV